MTQSTNIPGSSSLCKLLSARHTLEGKLCHFFQTLQMLVNSSAYGFYGEAANMQEGSLSQAKNDSQLFYIIKRSS